MFCDSSLSCQVHQSLLQAAGIRGWEGGVTTQDGWLLCGWGQSPRWGSSWEPVTATVIAAAGGCLGQCGGEQRRAQVTWLSHSSPRHPSGFMAGTLGPSPLVSGRQIRDERALPGQKWPVVFIESSHFTQTVEALSGLPTYQPRALCHLLWMSHALWSSQHLQRPPGCGCFWKIWRFLNPP